MGKDKWTAITNDAKSLWTKINPKSQAVILGELKQTDKRSVSFSDSIDSNDDANETADDEQQDSNAEDLIAMMMKKAGQGKGPSNGTKPKSAMSKAPPGDIRKMLSNVAQTSSSGVTYKVTAHIFSDPHPPLYESSIQYRININQQSDRGALVDRGANGGIIGECDA